MGANVEQILVDLKASNVARNEPVLVVGGGVIADIGGFACALYHRNTPYVMLCTSIVSGIDSAPSTLAGCAMALRRLSRWHVWRTTVCSVSWRRLASSSSRQSLETKPPIRSRPANATSSLARPWRDMSEANTATSGKHTSAGPTRLDTPGHRVMNCLRVCCTATRLVPAWVTVPISRTSRDG